MSVCKSLFRPRSSRIKRRHDMDTNSDPVPPRQNVVPSAEKPDSSHQGLEFLFSPLLEEYYNPTHGQAEENNNESAPNASFKKMKLSKSFLYTVKLKWLWKNKKDEYQTVIRNKARLVAKGYAQEEGIDFEESFAPVARLKQFDFRLQHQHTSLSNLSDGRENGISYGSPERSEVNQAPRAWYDELSKHPKSSKELTKGFELTAFSDADSRCLKLEKHCLEGNIFHGDNIVTGCQRTELHCNVSVEAKSMWRYLTSCAQVHKLLSKSSYAISMSYLHRTFQSDNLLVFTMTNGNPSSVIIKQHCGRYGHFELTVMPFGLTNAYAVFMKVMNRVCKSYLDKFFTVFIEDILIYSKSKEEHEVHLKLILELLEKEKFEGLQGGSSKNEAVNQLESPKNSTEIRSFLDDRILQADISQTFSKIATSHPVDDKRQKVLSGSNKVIAYTSRQLKINEKNYTTHDLDSLSKSRETISVDTLSGGLSEFVPLYWRFCQRTVHCSGVLSFLTAVCPIRQRFLKTISRSDLGTNLCQISFLGSGLVIVLHSGPFKMGRCGDKIATGTDGPYLGPERDRVVADLSQAEKDRQAGIRATNILLQGLPRDIYKLINHNTDAKDIWINEKMFTKLINDMRHIKMTMPKIQLNSKFVNNLPEWGRFVMAVKLNSGLKESNHD
ncbi:integrase, catalytic region, zinc finger, CCHC-type containing protein [Tanacetum coccineum]